MEIYEICNGRRLFVLAVWESPSTFTEDDGGGSWHVLCQAIKTPMPYTQLEIMNVLSRRSVIV